MGSSNSSPILVGGRLSTQSGSFEAPVTGSGASRSVGWPAREKILRGHTRLDLVFEPADLVCRIRWNIDRRECCLSRVSTARVVFEVCGTTSAPDKPLRGTPTLVLVNAGRQALRAWTAEVVVARRTPGGRYLSFGSKVKTAESRELVEMLRLPPKSTSPWTGTSNTFTLWPGSRGHRFVEGSTGSWYSMSPSRTYYQSR